MRRPFVFTSILALSLLAGCDAAERLKRLHHRDGPAPVPPEILAMASTATEWVGGPPHARGEPAAIGILILWNAYDPACLAMMPAIEAWRDAYARFGVRITGLHFAAYDFAADSAVVGANVRRLGLRFPSAVLPVPPPAGLQAGRGPVVIWPGGGDPAPQWLSSASDAGVFEARIRRKLRELKPEAGFPADGAQGIAREGPLPQPIRTLALGTTNVTRGPLRGATPDRPQPFVTSFRPEQEGVLDTPVPVGWWMPRVHALESAQAGAANHLAIRYDAGPVGLVIAPPAGAAGRVWILQDEKWLTAESAGADVKFDANGASYVEVSEPRWCSISRGGPHVLKLSPDGAGIRFYALTFEAATARP